MNVDFSLYLVTDSTSAILGDRNLLSVVESSVKGGVTIVQLRDKTSGTAELIGVASKLKCITDKYKLPLIINDRVDVALAVGAEGVHLGQDDMSKFRLPRYMRIRKTDKPDIQTARRILGEGAIIGASVSTSEQAIDAVKQGATYLGIGTVYATTTKEDSKTIIGISGVRRILSSLRATGYDTIPTVCIGGINPLNVQRTVYKSWVPGKGIDGVAVVSAIIASSDPCTTAQALLELIKNPPPFALNIQKFAGDTKSLLGDIPQILVDVVRRKPLNHNMTNLVVQNFAANVALAVGSSPIMSNNAAEAQDLAKAGGSLVINMGTITRQNLESYVSASQFYNTLGNPIVFDPVGGGASLERQNAAKTLMEQAYFDVIKGNESEILTLFGEQHEPLQPGVDSKSSTLSDLHKARMVKELAVRERCVILMTGETDIVSDGDRVYAIKNGHEYLSSITGSGCCLGTVIAAFLKVHCENKLQAVLAATLLYEIAAEVAATRTDVKGPGTFVPAFIDELYNIRQKTASGTCDWLDRTQIASFDIE